MSTWEKLAVLPREIVLTIVLIAMIVPAIRPFRAANNGWEDV